eukprot:2476702-Lingulodinium_polyedra.AAC.1
MGWGAGAIERHIAAASPGETPEEVFVRRENYRVEWQRTLRGLLAQGDPNGLFRFLRRRLDRWQMQ